MQPPTLNGVVKPADQIARGPHVWNEATRKYEERPAIFSEFPRAMWHETKGYAEAKDKNEQLKMQSEGWQTKPFPEKPKEKETIVAPAADLALIVLQQQQTMKAMQDQLEQLQAQQPTTTPAIPEVAKRGPGRPPVHKPEEVQGA
jgi:hypothetical protein